MYWIDSGDNCVYSFDYDVDTAEIRNKKTCLVCPPNSGVFDGMTIDSQGMLWIAHWDGYRVAQYHPGKGKCLRSFPIPVAKATAVAFGGHRLDKLYITTARMASPENFAEGKKGIDPHAGGVFCIDFKDTGIRGIEAFSFAMDLFGHSYHDV